jgi:hypothetical protein
MNTFPGIVGTGVQQPGERDFRSSKTKAGAACCGSPREGCKLASLEFMESGLIEDKNINRKPSQKMTPFPFFASPLEGGEVGQSRMSGGHSRHRTGAVFQHLGGNNRRRECGGG